MDRVRDRSTSGNHRGTEGHTGGEGEAMTPEMTREWIEKEIAALEATIRALKAILEGEITP